jgi:hypothetical protein
LGSICTDTNVCLTIDTTLIPNSTGIIRGLVDVYRERDIYAIVMSMDDNSIDYIHRSLKV